MIYVSYRHSSYTGNVTGFGWATIDIDMPKCTEDVEDMVDKIKTCELVDKVIPISFQQL